MVSYKALNTKFEFSYQNLIAVFKFMYLYVYK